MNKLLFLFIAVLVLIGINPLLGQEPDPYQLWQTTDPLGYSGFVIHPNGNIIANRNCEFFEIDGNTGQLLRVFPVHYGYSEIESVTLSSDGKYFAATYWGADSSTTFIFDYQTGEVFRKFKRMGDNIRFMSDSKRILITTFDRGHPNASLSVYNLEDESFQNFGAGFSSEGFAEIAVSDDGRYFATGGRKIEQVGLEEKTFVYLRLWDAVTLKPIKQLDKIEGDNEVRSIKFSPDGKYVGFQVYLRDLYIYKLGEMNLFKHYDESSVEYGVIYFCFLDNDLIGLSSGESFSKRNFMIMNLLNDKKVFYRHGKSGLLGYNPFHNSFLVRNEGIESYDLNKIVSNVTEPIQKNNFSIHFIKNTLILSGLNSISGQVNITISDINGRVIRKLDSPFANSELRIPIKLLNGTYFIHIKDGNKEYSSKFLVAE
ncbi:MAG: T9SS type A sorting domain-containing protein [Candidatus Kapabacteria bacterium]|nr:T9SS type A sorting domain-containing protein [Candidatus Kapabacteria bacterium]